VDWRLRQVEVYRRQGQALQLRSTQHDADTLDSPLLPGFECQVSTLFEDLPR